MRVRGRLVVAVVASCTVASALALNTASAATPDSRIRLNEIQVIGTHNSYHIESSANEKQLRASFDPVGAPALEYGHSKLATQFSRQNVRQIELDVFADPNGGLYARPLIRSLSGGGPYAAAMNNPGIKVLHIQDIDYGSNCLTLDRCLREVKAWSDAHPSHVPIQILVQLVDTPLNLPNTSFTLSQPIVWDARQMNALDAQIRAVFKPNDLVTPDSVRGSYPTLRDAIAKKGWPTLAQSRGKVMFLMDNSGAYRTRYLVGHPSLKGRVLFTNSTPGQADAAFVVVNDPRGANFARIQQLVKAGYIVRTRADVDTVQARTGDTAMRNAALASGAQMVSTDYPIAGIARRFGTNYVAQLPTGTPARCNPVKTSPGCRNALLSNG